MLRLNNTLFLYLRIEKPYSNTTNVKVKPQISEIQQRIINDSNTTNVKVKLLWWHLELNTVADSNTTNVKVKQNKIRC